MSIVLSLHRYPVKSLRGERLPTVEVDQRGLSGDRTWAVVDSDGRIGSGKSTRRFRRMEGLLELSSRYEGPVPVVRLPDGREVHGAGAAADAALSEHLGRPVVLGAEDEVPHHDDGPVHLVTTASLRWASAAVGAPVALERLRPNVVVETGTDEGLVEQSWLGRRITLGSVCLHIVAAMPRCVMLDQPQPGVDVGGGLLRRLGELNEGCLGVLAEVVRGGLLREGDPVAVLPPG